MISFASKIFCSCLFPAPNTECLYNSYSRKNARLLGTNLQRISFLFPAFPAPQALPALSTIPTLPALPALPALPTPPALPALIILQTHLVAGECSRGRWRRGKGGGGAVQRFDLGSASSTDFGFGFGLDIWFGAEIWLVVEIRFEGWASVGGSDSIWKLIFDLGVEIRFESCRSLGFDFGFEIRFGPEIWFGSWDLILELRFDLAAVGRTEVVTLV